MQKLSEYGASIGAALAGLIANSAPAKIDSFMNGSKLKNTSTVTVGGTVAEDDTFTVDITLPDSIPLADLDQSVTVTADSDDDETDVASKIAIAIEALSDFAPYVSASAALGVVTIASLVDGLEITLAVSKVSTAGTIVLAETIEASRGSALAFGLGVDRVDASEAQVHQSGGTCIGVALRSHQVENAGLESESSYPALSCLSVMRQGVVWVKVNGAVSAGQAAYCVHTTDVGQFRADNTNADAVSGAVFESDAASGGLAKLRLNQ